MRKQSINHIDAKVQNCFQCIHHSRTTVLEYLIYCKRLDEPFLIADGYHANNVPEACPLPHWTPMDEMIHRNRLHNWMRNKRPEQLMPGTYALAGRSFVRYAISLPLPPGHYCNYLYSYYVTSLITAVVPTDKQPVGSCRSLVHFGRAL